MASTKEERIEAVSRMQIRAALRNRDEVNAKALADLSSGSHLLDTGRIGALQQAAAQCRLALLLEAALDDEGTSAEQAVREVMKEANRWLRDTSTTTSAVDRAQREYDRNAAISFLTNWEQLIG